FGVAEDGKAQHRVGGLGEGWGQGAGGQQQGGEQGAEVHSGSLVWWWLVSGLGRSSSPIAARGVRRSRGCRDPARQGVLVITPGCRGGTRHSRAWEGRAPARPRTVSCRSLCRPHG